MAEVYVLTKIRIKFRKWGCMKFIGHLDMMRYFQKAIRRANIDICYSEGFSPHMIMSFAAPLGVGITSDSEYFDIEVHSTTSTKEAMKALNATMVDGIEVNGYVELPDNAKTAMAIIAAADYTLFFKEGYDSLLSVEEWKHLIEMHFHGQDEFKIMKKTKKSEKEVDLKPLVYRFDMEEVMGLPVFKFCVSTGSVDNVKPELVLAALFVKAGLIYDENAIQIHRDEVYSRTENGELISLLDMGQEIA